MKRFFLLFFTMAIMLVANIPKANCNRVYVNDFDQIDHLQFTSMDAVQPELMYNPIDYAEVGISPVSNVDIASYLYKTNCEISLLPISVNENFIFESHGMQILYIKNSIRFENEWINTDYSYIHTLNESEVEIRHGNIFLTSIYYIFM